VPFISTTLFYCYAQGQCTHFSQTKAPEEEANQSKLTKHHFLFIQKKRLHCLVIVSNVLLTAGPRVVETRYGSELPINTNTLKF
jgi:hypothetical protein